MFSTSWYFPETGVGLAKFSFADQWAFNPSQGDQNAERFTPGQCTLVPQALPGRDTRAKIKVTSARAQQPGSRVEVRYTGGSHDHWHVGEFPSRCLMLDCCRDGHSRGAGQSAAEPERRARPCARPPRRQGARTLEARVRASAEFILKASHRSTTMDPCAVRPHAHDGRSEVADIIADPRAGCFVLRGACACALHNHGLPKVVLKS